MKMLARLRYLLAEGFEVGNVSGYDAPPGSDQPGRGCITYVRTTANGNRRLVTEEFSVTGIEAKRCTNLFLRATIR